MAEEIPWDASNGGEVSKDPSRGGGARRPQKGDPMQRVRNGGRRGGPAREKTVAAGGGNDPTHANMPAIRNITRYSRPWIS